jgi:hypothetical protein
MHLHLLGQAVTEKCQNLKTKALGNYSKTQETTPLTLQHHIPELIYLNHILKHSLKIQQFANCNRLLVQLNSRKFNCNSKLYFNRWYKSDQSETTYDLWWLKSEVFTAVTSTVTSTSQTVLQPDR